MPASTPERPAPAHFGMRHGVAARLDLGLRSAGATLAAFAVALSAYASHAAEGDRTRLFIAAAIAFGHALALAVLPAIAPGRTARMASCLLLAGCVLFAGSLVAAHLFGASTRLAPVGGLSMIIGWLLHAAAPWRR